MHTRQKPTLAIVPQVDVGEYIAALSASEVGQKILTEKREADRRHRKDLCDEIERLERQAEKEQPPLMAIIAKWRAECMRLFSIVTMGVAVTDPSMTMEALQEIGRAKVKAQADLLVGRHELAIVQLKLTAISSAYTTRRDEVEQKLRAGANPILKIFRDEMLDEHARTRRNRAHTFEAIQKNGRRVLMSNGRSIADRLAAIRAAIRQADDLALQADQSNIDLELEKIRQSLPPVGAPEVVQ